MVQFSSPRSHDECVRYLGGSIKMSEHERTKIADWISDAASAAAAAHSAADGGRSKSKDVGTHTTEPQALSPNQTSWVMAVLCQL